MSDDEKRIEVLENQLRITKLEKELAETKSKNTREEKEMFKDDDDTPSTNKGQIFSAIIKLILIAIVALILSELFPNIFSDRIEYTNPVTGEKISVPIDKDDPALTYTDLKAFPYNGFLIKYDAAMTSNAKALQVAKMCTYHVNTQEGVDSCVYANLYEAF